MKYIDIKEGNYYCVDYDSHTAIIKAFKNSTLMGSEGVGMAYYKTNGWSSKKNLRKATYQEIEYLKECSRKNEKVKNISINYEIY